MIFRLINISYLSSNSNYACTRICYNYRMISTCRKIKMYVCLHPTRLYRIDSFRTASCQAPSMPWRAAFSAEPSFHPLWEAIAWMARFPTIPSSSNSRFLSSTFVLSKISLSLFRLSSVFLFSFSISCFWFSLSVMVMVPWGTAEIVVESALSFYRKSFINHQSSEPYTSKPTNNNIAPTKSQPIKRILSCGLYFRATFFL